MQHSRNNDFRLAAIFLEIRVTLRSGRCVRVYNILQIGKHVTIVRRTDSRCLDESLGKLTSSPRL